MHKPYYLWIRIEKALLITIAVFMVISGRRTIITRENRESPQYSLASISSIVKKTEIIPQKEEEINVSAFRREIISQEPIEILDIKESKKAQPKEAPVYASTDYTFVYLNGNILKQYYDLAISRYMLIPENVRKKLQESGWKLTLTTEQLEDTWFSHLKNILVCAGTHEGLCEIRLENSQNGAKAVVHEMGHFVQTFMTQDDFTEWENIYAAENGNMTKYAKSSSWEAFAECFEELYVNPRAISDCPMAKDFIKKIVVQIV